MTTNRKPRAPKLFPAAIQPSGPILREYGSERETFPYWKVQYFDGRSMVWKDIQEKHNEQPLAELEGKRVKAQKGRARLMEVRRDGRAPLPEL